MDLESGVMIAICFLLGLYLCYALLYPERF
jgi:K+-transporting ATPase KdpF subunit